MTVYNILHENEFDMPEIKTFSSKAAAEREVKRLIGEIYLDRMRAYIKAPENEKEEVIDFIRDDGCSYDEFVCDVEDEKRCDDILVYRVFFSADTFSIFKNTTQC